MGRAPEHPGFVVGKGSAVSGSEQGPEEHRLSFGVVQAFSRSKPGREGPNQDAFGVVERGGCALLVVADGLGGHAAGSAASRLAVEGVCAVLAGDEGEPGDLRPAVLDAIEEANRSIVALGVGAGTTLAVAEMSTGRMRPYHVGDSEIWVVGQRGRVKLRLLAHSPVAYAEAAGLLDTDEALAHPDRHFVWNALGDQEMRVEVGSPLELAPRDTVLIASDGLLDNLTPDELVEIIRKGPLDRAAAKLADLAWGRMVEPREGAPSKPDDLTFILFRSARPAGLGGRAKVCREGP